MTPTTLTIGSGLGGLCLLNTAPCLRQAMFDAADSVGCGKFVPAVPPRTTVLRSAIEDVAAMLYGKRRKQPIKVHLTADQNAFEAVRVVTRHAKNDYVFLFSASIDENWNVSVLEYSLDGTTNGHVIHHHLERLVQDKRDYLPAATVGQIAVKMLKEWKALPLLDNGGAWFLPGHRINDYRTFASGVASTSGPRFKVTTFEIASDPDTVETVLDRLHADVTAGMQEIMADVMEATGGMADRSINVRLDRANVFLDKVRQYEKILGKPLPDLTDAIEQVKQAVAVNRLLSAAV